MVTAQAGASGTAIQLLNPTVARDRLSNAGSIARGPRDRSAPTENRLLERMPSFAAAHPNGTETENEPWSEPATRWTLGKLAKTFG